MKVFVCRGDKILIRSTRKLSNTTQQTTRLRRMMLRHLFYFQLHVVLNSSRLALVLSDHSQRRRAMPFVFHIAICFCSNASDRKRDFIATYAPVQLFWLSVHIQDYSSVAFAFLIESLLFHPMDQCCFNDDQRIRLDSSRRRKILKRSCSNLVSMTTSSYGRRPLQKKKHTEAVLDLNSYDNWLRISHSLI